MGKHKKSHSDSTLIASNRKARHDYFVETTLEAGLVLEGWEVKSLRQGRAQLRDSYVYIDKGEAWLQGTHISPLTSAIHPRRPDSDKSSQIAASPARSRPPDRSGGTTRLYRRGSQNVLESWARESANRPRQGKTPARQTGDGARSRLAEAEGPHLEVRRLTVRWRIACTPFIIARFRGGDMASTWVAKP